MWVSDLVNWCNIKLWLDFSIMLMKLMIMMLLILCSCSWCMIFLVVFRLFLVIVCLRLFLVLVNLLVLMLMIVMVLVWLIISVLFDGNYILWFIVLVSCLLMWCIVKMFGVDWLFGLLVDLYLVNFEINLGVIEFMYLLIVF